LSLSDQADRYVRQSQFDPIGVAGQQQIEQSRVAVLGCGALGSVTAELLARAGVGSLRLIDRDLVEWSNLQRQSLYTEADAEAGRAKVEAAANHLRQINSTIQIDEVVADVTSANVADCLGKVDLVVDGSDNFPLRLLLNDYSLRHRIPWVHGGCIGATGQVRLFHGRSPCFRCLVPSPPDPATVATCDTAGVLGAATHLIASLQVAEALKILSGNADATRTEVWAVDLWANQLRSIRLDETLSPDCPACVGGQFDFLDAAAPDATAATGLCGRDAIQIAGGHFRVDFDRIAKAWRPVGTVEKTRFFVRLSIDEAQSLTLFRDGRALITGVRDTAHARTLYDRFVGS